MHLQPNPFTGLVGRCVRILSVRLLRPPPFRCRDTPDVPRTHLCAARGLENTCWTLYADSPTGLSPDEVVMNAKFASSEASSLDGLWATHLAWWERSGGHGDPPGLRPVEPVQKEYMRDY